MSCQTYVAYIDRWLRRTVAVHRSIAVDMGVQVINTELSGDPNQQEICNGMWFRSMEELLPIIEREGIRVEIQSHPMIL